MPPNPKRRTSRRGEPPFEDGDILRADDPRPQRVPQYPSNTVGRRRKNEEHIPTSVYETEEQDEELKASYDGKGLDTGGRPAFLYVEKGPGAGQLVPVRQGVLVIGRASVSDLRLQHPSISRRHAQLTRRGERFFFKDLGSQNGTFVNKERIDGEVELKPGDAIGMGAALLKLRGPLAKHETIGDKDRLRAQRHEPTAVVQRPRTSGVVKAAMFAGAVGFGLAAVLAFALLRGPAPAKAKADAKPARTVSVPEQQVPAKTRRFQAEPATDEIEIAAGPISITHEKRIDEAIDKKMAEHRAAAPAPRPAEPAEAAAEKKASSADPKKAPAAKEEPVVKTAPPAKRAGLLAAYERGDAEASLEAAREAGDKVLVSQLQRFTRTWDEADAAFSRNDAQGAISKYTEALALDEKISGGFSKYGADARKKLAHIWLLAASQFSKNDQTDSAVSALKESLKYDPSNAKAKAMLKELDKGAGRAETDDEDAAPARGKKASSQAADDAFGDEGAEASAPKKPAKKPAEKPAAKAKATRSAIDDAFGD